jgi:hypothetical protein
MLGEIRRSDFLRTHYYISKDGVSASTAAGEPVQLKKWADLVEVVPHQFLFSDGSKIVVTILYPFHAALLKEMRIKGGTEFKKASAKGFHRWWLK